MNNVCDPTLIVSAIEDSAFDAVTKLLKKEKEDLEIELAKTKLALVETECKNQDLTHQLTVVNDASSNSQQQGNKTWFSGKSIFNSANRTLSSIRYETRPLIFTTPWQTKGFGDHLKILFVPYRLRFFLGQFSKAK